MRWATSSTPSRNRFAWHAAFWTVHTINELLIAVVEQRSPFYVGSQVLRTYGALATVAYLNLFILVPRILRGGRRVGYAVSLMIVAIASAYLYVAFLYGQFGWSDDVARRTLRWTFTGLLYAGMVAALDVAIRNMELQRAVAVQRLEQLRAQLDPHFLFNTLNSLYALALRRAPELPDLMLRHAALLRHSLEQSRHSHVSLVSEIEFLGAYIELQRLRLDNDVTGVEFEVLGIVGDRPIAPMLFTPLVENCFKHVGVCEDKRSTINIQLAVTDTVVHLTLRNTVGSATRAAGIGLAATRERLALLYPGRHDLTAGASDGEYVCELHLALASLR